MLKWYESRGCWLGITAFSIGAVEIIQQLVVAHDFSVAGIITAVLGILKVAERVTSQGDIIVS